MMTIKIESALIIVVAEAERLVGSYRAQYDPSAADRMPPHITLLYPFVAPTEIDHAVLAQLREVLASHEPFALQLTEIRRFPHVLYLVPNPDSTMKSLMEDIFRTFPEQPPYGGVFTEVIPHLTIAQVDDKKLLSQIADAFTQEARDHLPLLTQVSAVQLWENSSGSWRRRERLMLGKG